MLLCLCRFVRGLSKTEENEIFVVSIGHGGGGLLDRGLSVS